jgi:hypothetical protein
VAEDLDGRYQRYDRVIAAEMVGEGSGVFAAYSYVREVKTGNIWTVTTARLPEGLRAGDACNVIVSRVVEVRRRTRPNPRAGQVIE